MDPRQRRDVQHQNHALFATRTAAMPLEAHALGILNLQHLTYIIKIAAKISQEESLLVLN